MNCIKEKRLPILLSILVLALLTTGCTSGGSRNGDAVSNDINAEGAENSVLEDSSISSLDSGELDRYISEAIISENRSIFKSDEAQMFATEYHKTLKTVEQEDSVTVYLIALYAQYQGSDDKIKLTGAVCSPVSIVFTKDNEQYVLNEYWVPKDGEGYEQSIREKIPSDIIGNALEFELPDGMEICDQNARDYFGVPYVAGYLHQP